jgi:transposase-like protein
MDLAPAPAKPKRRTKLSKPERYRTQILTALDQGQSQRQIAAKLGMAPSSISSWLDTIDQEKHELSRFRSSRVDALSQVQGKALALQVKLLDELMRDGLPIDATVSQKAGLMQTLNIMMGTSFDKERLESGQSTHNLNVVSRMVDTVIGGMYKPVETTRDTVPASNEGAGSAAEDVAERPASQESEGGEAGG